MNKKILDKNFNVDGFNKCVDEIAEVLDKYLFRGIEDGDGIVLINRLVQDQIKLGRKLQAQENVEINGGSR